MGFIQRHSEVDKPVGKAEENGLLVTWDHHVLLKDGGLLSTFDSTDPQVARWLIAVWESQAESITDHLGKPFTVSDYLAGPVTFREQQSGEEWDGVRMLLLSGDHRPIATCDTKIGPFLQTCSKRAGMPPWEPPLTIRLDRPKGRKALAKWRYTMLD